MKVIRDILLGAAILVLMAIVAIPSYTIPPRRLEAQHILPFLLVPAFTFLAASPKIRVRWFGYIAAIFAAFLIAGSGHHIRGTNLQLGWDDSTMKFLLPSCMFVATVTLSVLSARLRQVLQARISRTLCHANNALETSPDSAPSAESGTSQG